LTVSIAAGIRREKKAAENAEENDEYPKRDARRCIWTVPVLFSSFDIQNCAVLFFGRGRGLEESSRSHEHLFLLVLLARVERGDPEVQRS
tara:strand:- start:606 stop:875 length:270 start_codon:yes stop_codon:yes gene_type:complete